MNCMLIFFSPALFAQPNQDSQMLAHCEKWNVKPNKGLFGLSKPIFGPYIYSEVSKLDSPVIKMKTRDSSYLETTGKGFDVFKYMTIKKTKFYKLEIADTEDTIQAVFAISSVSKEKHQTFLAKMLSNNNENNDEILNYNRDIPGIITTGKDSLPWKFSIDNFTSSGRQTSSGPFGIGYATISGGYLMSQEDSLFIWPGSSFSADMVLINQNGKHFAALTYKQKRPDIWIRNDIEQSYQQAIAAFFAVIISIKDF